MKNTIPILIIVSMMMLIPVGYAMSYNSMAECPYGDIDASCITMEPVVYDGTEYVPSAVITEKALVTKTNTTYTLSASAVRLSPENLYLDIRGAGYSGSVTVSCDATVTGTGSCAVLLDGSALTERTVSQGYHSLAVTYTGSYTGSSMPTSSISLTLTARAQAEGSVLTTNDTLRLKVTSSATVLEMMNENNPDIVASDDYQFSTTTSTNHGNNYPAVGVQNENNNQNGIADRDGNIDVEITVPSGPAFVLYLRTSGNNTFTLTMTKGDEVLVSGTVTFNSGIGTSGYYLSSKSYDGSSGGYFYSSLNNVNTYDAWMSGDSQDISIVIVTEDGQSASRNLKMDIVFKKES